MIINQRILNEVIVNKGGTTAGKVSTAAHVAGGVVLGALATLLAPPTGGASWAVGAGIFGLASNRLNKWYNQHVLSKFKQLDSEGNLVEVTEQLLVKAVEKALQVAQSVDQEGEADPREVVKKDLLSRFADAPEEYKKMIRFEEHKILDADGDHEAKKILMEVLSELGMFQEDDAVQSAFRTVKKGVDFMSNPGKTVKDTLMAGRIRMTESELRRTIRKVILEARPRKNPRHDLMTHPGIGMAHADSTGVNCDFNSSWHQLLSDQVWMKLGSLHYVGDWSMPDGGDGYRFINGILQCRCKETGMIMMAVYCVDRANSHNATKTSYDVYVIDVEDVQENHTEYGSNDISDRDLSSSSREWAKKGEYCTNVQQIVDTLKDAYDHYEKLLDSGQI